MADDTPTIRFCFDYISPYSYLAATQITALAHRHDIDLVWQPINLPRLIKLTGNLPPSTIRNKARYLLHDLKRTAGYLDVPFRMILPGAFDSRPALAATEALAEAHREKAALAIFTALWAEGWDYQQEDWLLRLFEAKAVPEEWVLMDDAYLQHLDEVNDVTVTIHKAGAFGAPTFFLEGMGRRQMFWGVDRMDHLERAIVAHHDSD